MDEFLALCKTGDLGAARTQLDRHPELLAARNSQGVSLLALSLYHGQPGIARLFAERRPLDFWEACMLGDLPRVAECLPHHGVNALAPDGFPPFALAVFFGQPAVYRYLLDQGADVNQPAANPMRVAAIHAAVSRKDSEALALILSSGGNVNATQQSGWTALHAAAASGNHKMVEMLLAAGADPEALTDKSETPAQLARLSGDSDLHL